MAVRRDPALSGKSSLKYGDALLLVNQYGRDAAWILHCKAVSLLAERYAAIFSSGYDIDADFVRTAALLHDIGRYKTHDPIMHGVEGYWLLTNLGHHREAFVCASHILCGLEREEAVRHGLPDQDFIPRTFEERLIPVIDSLVEFDRPTTLHARVASIQLRYQGNDGYLQKIEQAAEKAQRFMDHVNREFGISMENVAAETLSSEIV
ncbi:MAG: HDIG domain-containing protein [Nitrospiraceae bacterium]|nr:HDIG domain-containing protein [Nitrospiraceae bacterium]